jgi:diacylglycerol kinase (ATP)
VSRVNRSRYKGGGLRGSAVFLRESIAALMRFGGRRVRIRSDDDGPTERTVQSIVIANGQYFGGGMHVAPHARVDDGKFDVVIIDAMSRARSLTSMPSLYRGTHLNRPGVELRRATRVVIEALDAPLLFDVEGEQVGQTPATVTCLPSAIAICAPAAFAAP